MRMLRLALLVVLCAAGSAEARRAQSFHYPFSRVWTSAVRMLRVDLNSPITEKDKEDGYFLFEYEDAGQRHPGSVELIQISEKGVPEIQVVIQVPALPSYVEQMLLDRLDKKLQKEYGPPRDPAPPPPPDERKPAAPDKGKRDGKREVDEGRGEGDDRQPEGERRTKRD